MDEQAAGPSEAIAIWMTHRGYATGHGDTIEDMLGELEAQARERVRGEVPETLILLDREAADTECRSLWGERNEDCARHGADIPMPRVQVRVDELRALLGLPSLVGAKAREWAGHYTPSSDGYNTFLMFAEWAEKL